MVCARIAGSLFVFVLLLGIHSLNRTPFGFLKEHPLQKLQWDKTRAIYNAKCNIAFQFL